MLNSATQKKNDKKERPMSYVPSSHAKLSLPEIVPEDLPPLSETSIVRLLPVRYAALRDGFFFLGPDRDNLVRVDSDRRMTFGGETVRPTPEGPLVEICWIRIEYVGERLEDGKFSLKEDGLFALRAKAGEKAERRAAQVLAGYFAPNRAIRDAIELGEATEGSDRFDAWADVDGCRAEEPPRSPGRAS